MNRSVNRAVIEPVIHIKDLAFAHPALESEGGFRLDIPDLEIAAGSRTAIVGPSGTGKTTLLNLMSGILLPEQGRISLEGEDIARLSDTARRAFRIRRIGFVFQSFALVEYLSAFENILYPYRITGHLTLDDATKARARDLAGRVGLGDKLGRKPAELSQGEQQRIAICRALITAPALVFADEATGNLDPENKSRILDLLFEQIAAEGATLVAVTHDHALLDRFDQVIDFATLRQAP